MKSQIRAHLIAEALSSLRPLSLYTVGSDESINWIDTVQTQPTQSEINAEIIRLASVYTAQEYSRQRAKEYPSIPDQLDTLYHSGLDAWKAQIKTVKDKFPKV